MKLLFLIISCIQTNQAFSEDAKGLIEKALNQNLSGVAVWGDGLLPPGDTKNWGATEPGAPLPTIPGLPPLPMEPPLSNADKPKQLLLPFPELKSSPHPTDPLAPSLPIPPSQLPGGFTDPFPPIPNPFLPPPGGKPDPSLPGDGFLGPPPTGGFPGDPFSPGIGDSFVPGEHQNIVKRTVTIKDKVDSPHGYDFAPRLTYDGVLVIDLQIEKSALEDIYKVSEIINYLHFMGNQFRGFSFSNYGFWFEVFRNAKLGHIDSVVYMAKIRQLALQRVASRDFSKKEVESVFPGQRLDQSEIRRLSDIASLELFKLEKAQITEKERDLLEWQKKYDKLDSFDNQKVLLKKLVANNDREGVAKLLEVYLPWAQMSPTEVVIWNRWIESIRNPSPPDKRRLIFRGIGGGEPLYKSEKGRFLLSNFLRFAPGNYNERLRSFDDMRQTKGKFFGNASSEVPVTIAAIMNNHSLSAESSPFISSSVAQVAAGFLDQGKYVGIVAMFIDDRRLLKNSFAAGFGAEVERLIPFVVFPDEFLHFEEAKKIKLESAPSTFAGLPTDLDGLTTYEVDAEKAIKSAEAELEKRGIKKYLRSRDEKDWNKKLILDYLKKTSRSCESLMIDYHLAMARLQ